MIPQTFVLTDLRTLLSLVFLEGLLSADNALILAIMVQHLPREQQKKALFYGLVGAFVLRLGAILVASQLSTLWWIQLIGALYLIWMPIKHFVKSQSDAEHKGAGGASFWMTVILADLADLAFAVDSVLVAVAIEPHRDKVWVVYFGAVIGIVILRFAASWCLTLLERYPVLNHMAYVLVGWAGVKLLFLSGHTYGFDFEKHNPGKSAPLHIPELSPVIFWTGLLLIVAVGVWMAARDKADLSATEPDPNQPAESESESVDTSSIESALSTENIEPQ